MTVRVVPFDERHQPPAAAPPRRRRRNPVPADAPPAGTPHPAACPDCGAGPDQWQKSAGFGAPHDVCLRCGHEFRE